MRIARMKAFAEYSNFIITDAFDYMTPMPDITEESCRRGYLVQKPNIVYHFIQNDSWNFPLTIDYESSAPDYFGSAERVIHLPVAIEGQMLLHGSTDWEPDSFHKLPITTGKYSIFSLAWDLGKLGDREDMFDMSSDEYISQIDIERYHWIICPQVSPVPYVISGPEFLY